MVPPFAPYPDGRPEDFTDRLLEKDVRAPGSIIRYSHGDFGFSSGIWRTRHGSAEVVRYDDGAHRVWGARLPDGRRVHCRQSWAPGGRRGPWRRRSDDGRSWVVGQIVFETDEVRFTDGPAYREPEPLDANDFERAMAGQAEFRAALRDDSFAFTLNRALWVEGLCTLDGRTRWDPSRGLAGGTIARLRELGEFYLEFKLGGPEPEPPPMPRAIIEEALAAAGWRFD